MRNVKPTVQILGIFKLSVHLTEPLITNTYIHTYIHTYIKGHLIIHHEGIRGTSGIVLLFL